jgi:hypothetical protein
VAASRATGGTAGDVAAGDKAGEEQGGFTVGDRRACSFRIDFTRVGADVTRGEAALWQSRIREAVYLWQAEQEGQFKLR